MFNIFYIIFFVTAGLEHHKDDPDPMSVFDFTPLGPGCLALATTLVSTKSQKQSESVLIDQSKGCRCRYMSQVSVFKHKSHSVFGCLSIAASISDGITVVKLDTTRMQLILAAASMLRCFCIALLKYKTVLIFNMVDHEFWEEFLNLYKLYPCLWNSKYYYRQNKGTQTPTDKVDTRY